MIDINLIGAFIVTIWLAAIIKMRPSFANGEKRLRSLSWALILLLAGFLFSVACYEDAPWDDQLQVVWITNHVLSFTMLWIHEAGHVYFSWDGELLHAFGGTLNEILFTLGPAIYCIYRNYIMLFSLFIFSLGHNCIGIARYMADAQERKLPLFGLEDASGHDWHIIFAALGWLEYDKKIAAVVTFFAWTTITVGLLILVSTSLGPKEDVATDAPQQ